MSWIWNVMQNNLKQLCILESLEKYNVLNHENSVQSGEN